MNKLIIFLLFSFSCHADLFFIDPIDGYPLSPVEETGIGTPDYLMMPPNIYGFNGPSYDCTEEGLYLYFTPPTSLAQRIVYNGDIETLLHSITWIHAHGYLDDNASFSTAMNAAKTRRIHMTCGSICQFTNNLLNTLAIPSRFILFLTLDDWNLYNNGHSLVEVKIDGNWVLYDIDLRNYFTQDNEVLNARQFVDAVANANYEIHSFSDSPSFAFGDLAYNGYDYAFFLESTFLFEGELKNFYDRSAQILLIRENGVFYFTCANQAERTRVESYDPGFIYMTPQNFVDHFYPMN